MSFTDRFRSEKKSVALSDAVDLRASHIVDCLKRGTSRLEAMLGRWRGGKFREEQVRGRVLDRSWAGKELEGSDEGRRGRGCQSIAMAIDLTDRARRREGYVEGNSV